MKITFAGKNSVPSDFAGSAEKKLQKFDRLFDDAAAQLKTDRRKSGESVELTIVSGGTIYRSEKTADTLNNALDECVEAIFRQIRKHKTRLEKKRAIKLPEVPEIVEPQEEEMPAFTVRTKSFPVKPMSVEDAILQMLLLEHDFFLFRNEQTGALNLVYKKSDGNYGLIIPD